MDHRSDGGHLSAPATPPGESDVVLISPSSKVSPNCHPLPHLWMSSTTFLVRGLSCGRPLAVRKPTNTRYHVTCAFYAGQVRRRSFK
ncbi:hypothetical protein Trydic_g10892 [Trypoxylus dichotomus]